MSVIVERGLARCPRCVAVADYTFVESGANSVRYEVHCGRCGESYCEVHSPVAPDFTTAVGVLAIRAPDVVLPVSATRRQWILARVEECRDHTSRLASRMSSWISLKRSAFRR